MNSFWEVAETRFEHWNKRQRDGEKKTKDILKRDINKNKCLNLRDRSFVAAFIILGYSLFSLYLRSYLFFRIELPNFLSWNFIDFFNLSFGHYYTTLFYSWETSFLLFRFPCLDWNFNFWNLFGFCQDLDQFELAYSDYCFSSTSKHLFRFQGVYFICKRSTAVGNWSLISL